METKKKAMTAAERKRKSREKQSIKMTEQEKEAFKAKERERVRKAVQKKRIEQRNEMSPSQLKELRKSEAERIKALRCKKKSLLAKSKEKENKSTAAAMLKMTASKRQYPYKTRQSFSKAVNKVRSNLPFSPRKQAAIVESLAEDFGYRINQSRRNTQNVNIDKIKAFYYRTDIVYTMPGKGDEMTIWDENGKHKLRKFYLTMYLREAHALYLETCENEIDRCSLSTFCHYRPKNVLLLGDSPKSQCKCQQHENLFLKLEAMGCSYESSWWETVLCDTTLNSPCWLNNCAVCKDGKTFIPRKMLNSNTVCKQWEYTEVPSQSKKKTGGEDGENEMYKKIAMVTKEVKVGEVLDNFQEDFAKIKQHQNIKRIQAAEFQNDLKDPTVRVLQIDYAMAYQCEMQEEIMGALWSRGSVNLFTCAIYQYGLKTKTMLFCTSYKGKDKYSTGLFLDMIYDNYMPDDDNVQSEVIWSDGPSSEFKNQFMRYHLQQLSIKLKKPFFWKFSATSHGKGVVDGVGGKVKSSVHKKVMSLGKDREVVQDSESFASLAKKLCESTTIIHVKPEEVQTYKDSDPFGNATAVKGISSMHVMKSDGISSYLWANSLYHRSGTKANISVTSSRNDDDFSSDGDDHVNEKPMIAQQMSVMAETTSEKSLSYHDVVKIIKGNFKGYYAIVTEPGDHSKLDGDDEIEINYLKKSFGKWVVGNNDLDSRMICELAYVEAEVDGRSRYTITE